MSNAPATRTLPADPWAEAPRPARTYVPRPMTAADRAYEDREEARLAAEEREYMLRNRWSY